MLFIGRYCDGCLNHPDESSGTLVNICLECVVHVAALAVVSWIHHHFLNPLLQDLEIELPV